MRAGAVGVVAAAEAVRLVVAEKGNRVLWRRVVDLCRAAVLLWRDVEPAMREVAALIRDRRTARHRVLPLGGKALQPAAPRLAGHAEEDLGLDVSMRRLVGIQRVMSIVVNRNPRNGLVEVAILNFVGVLNGYFLSSTASRRLV